MGRNFFKPFFRLALIYSLAGCAGNNLTPTPPVPVFGDFILGVATTTPPTGISNLRSMSFSSGGKALNFADDGIQVDETRNTVSEISFEAESLGETQVEFPGIFVVELVKQSALVNLEFPDFGVTQIPFESYTRFRMKFEKLNSEDIPPEVLPDPLVSQLLLDRTFVVTGSFREATGKDVNGDGRIDTVPFQILSDNEVEVEVSSPNFFTVSPDKVNFFFIAFQIETWFTDLLPQFQDLTSSDLSGGVAVIQKDSSNNKIDNILQAFEDNTERSCKSAPSDDAEFDEDDVDDESGSEPL